MAYKLRFQPAGAPVAARLGAISGLTAAGPSPPAEPPHRAAIRQPLQKEQPRGSPWSRMSVELRTRRGSSRRRHQPKLRRRPRDHRPRRPRPVDRHSADPPVRKRVLDGPLRSAAPPDRASSPHSRSGRVDSLFFRPGQKLVPGQQGPRRHADLRPRRRRPSSTPSSTPAPANVVFILAFNPMFAALLSWRFIGERPRLATIAGDPGHARRASRMIIWRRPRDRQLDRRPRRAGDGLPHRGAP